MDEEIERNCLKHDTTAHGGGLSNTADNKEKVQKHNCVSFQENLEMKQRIADESSNNNEDTNSLESFPMEHEMNYSDDIMQRADDSKNQRASTRSLRTRINRRPIQERPRQKRQTLQDMARPLKQWLYKHKDNPYPTKAEKVSLALGSQMTLTQVSNWFANARRRLKNTVRSPGVTWSSRIKLYNSHVQGNAELLSISSEESSLFWSDEEHTVTDDQDMRPKDLTENTSYTTQEDSKHSEVWRENNPTTDDLITDRFYRPIKDNVTSYSTPSDKSDHSYLQPSDMSSSGVHKFKQNIMQRYLQDTYQHSLTSPYSNRKRNPSRGSVGSHDYEELSSSSRSSPSHDHGGVFDDFVEELDGFVKQRNISEEQSTENDLYWKEISAAMALTHLARSSLSTPSIL